MTAKGLHARALAADRSALAQRDELLTQQRRAYELYGEHAAARQDAERAKGIAASKLREAEAALRKGAGDEAAVDAAVDACERAEADYARALDRGNRALAATKRADVELAQLYAERFTDFAAEADDVSAHADAAIERFVAAYHRAVEAWAQAQAAWAPVCQAVRVPGMEAFPLSEHVLAPILGGWNAKPAQIEVAEEWGDDLDEAADDCD
jgi:hypothetical protein